MYFRLTLLLEHSILQLVTYFKQKVMNTDLHPNEWVFEGQRPALIDFYATWCGPCRMVAPIISELAQEYDGKLVVGKCDVEENDDIAMEFGVRNIPTVLFFKGGQLVDKFVGAASKDKFEEKFKALLEK